MSDIIVSHAPTYCDKKEHGAYGISHARHDITQIDTVFPCHCSESQSYGVLVAYINSSVC